MGQLLVQSLYQDLQKQVSSSQPCSQIQETKVQLKAFLAIIQRSYMDFSEKEEKIGSINVGADLTKQTDSKAYHDRNRIFTTIQTSQPRGQLGARSLMNACEGTWYMLLRVKKLALGTEENETGSQHKLQGKTLNIKSKKDKAK